MNNQNNAVREVVESLFERAMNDVFIPTGLSLNNVTSDVTKADALSCQQVVGDSVLSVLSASGNGIKILCSINVGISTLEALHLSGKTVSIDELRDWCGELNNQIVGAAKNHLLAYDCKIMMGLPTLIQGENLASIVSSNAIVSQRSYLSSEGEIIAYLSTVIDPKLNILDTPDESLTGLVEGGELDFF